MHIVERGTFSAQMKWREDSKREERNVSLKLLYGGVPVTASTLNGADGHPDILTAQCDWRANSCKSEKP